jgi:hypothetical protein
VKRTQTVTPEQAIILQNIQNATHLAEDKDSRSFCLKGLKELIQNDHLARIFNEVLVRSVRRTWFLANNKIKEDQNNVSIGDLQHHQKDMGDK